MRKDTWRVSIITNAKICCHGSVSTFKCQISLFTLGGLNGYSAGKTMSIRKAPCKGGIVQRCKKGSHDRNNREVICMHYVQFTMHNAHVLREPCCMEQNLGPTSPATPTGWTRPPALIASS